jgi:enoyl-CoA hydratase
MNHENLNVETEGKIATLTLNRPDALNALNRKTLEELAAVLDSLKADDEVRVVVVTGAGKAFVAGADVAELKDMDEPAALAFSELGHGVMDAVQALPKPVIAAVNGFALGGGLEMALACDFIMASAKATFGFPEVNLGIFPGFGGTQRASRRIGPAKAKELIYTGNIIRAEEAFRIGLVNSVWAPDDLLPEVRKTGALIASKGPLAVKAVKPVIDEGLGRRLAEGCEIERRRFAGCFTTEDQKEGMSAFLEKRSPEFKGR